MVMLEFMVLVHAYTLAIQHCVNSFLGIQAVIMAVGLKY